MLDPEKLHRDSIVIDGHCDTLLQVGQGLYRYPARPARNFWEEGSSGHIDFPRLVKGGVTCQVMALYIEPQYKPTVSARRTLELLDAAYRLFEESSDFILATRAKDIIEAKRNGKVSALLSIEGGEAVEDSLPVLRSFYRLGVRAMGLTWNQRNDIADGVGEKSGSSLTEFGIALVKEMERLGMIVDVSHLSDSSFWSLHAVAERPYIASHSNARALCPHPRNLDDRQIEALAAKGGVIGVVFASNFVSEDPSRVSLGALVDHIDHIVKVAGIDHVGLGSDFDGFGVKEGAPVVMKDVSELPLLTRELVQRGYTEEGVRKILGGNWLRVYEQVIG